MRLMYYCFFHTDKPSLEHTYPSFKPMAAVSDKKQEYMCRPMKMTPETSRKWSIRIPEMIGNSNSKIESENQYRADIAVSGNTFTFPKAMGKLSSTENLTTTSLPRTITHTMEDIDRTNWTNLRLVSSVALADENVTHRHLNEKSRDTITNVQPSTSHCSSYNATRSMKSDALNTFTKMDTETWKNIPLNTSLNTFIDLGATAVSLRDLESKDVRACGSPESGIDCDDAHSPLQANLHEEQYIEKSLGVRLDKPLQPFDVNGLKEVSETVENDLVTTTSNEVLSNRTAITTRTQSPIIYSCTSSSLLSSEHDCQVSILNSDECTNKVIHEKSMLSEEILKSQLQQISKNEEVENRECDDLQILSVHSLAPGTAHSLRSGDHSRSVNVKSTDIPCRLPGCKRLYVRNIRTSKHGSKRVLVAELDYSRARPLPWWILNKQVKKKVVAQPVQLDDHVEDVVEVKVKKPMPPMTPKKEIPKKKYTSIAHHEKNSSFNLKRTFSTRSRGRSWDSRQVKKSRGHSNGEIIEIKNEFDDSDNTKEFNKNYDVNENKDGSTWTKNVMRNELTTPTLAPKLDRISQLREKLRQKEADLEKIRKTMNSFDDSPL